MESNSQVPTKFHQLRGSKVIDTFGIQRTNTCTELDNWLDAHGVLNDFESTTIKYAIQRFEKLGMSWNEEELKMHFISSILNICDINIDGICRTYFERPLEGLVQNKLMHVITDCMVAQPKLGGDPDKPYFFLQMGPPMRFKQKQLWGKTDPLKDKC